MDGDPEAHHAGHCANHLRSRYLPTMCRSVRSSASYQYEVRMMPRALPCGSGARGAAGAGGRGLHSSTFQLNLSALYGIRGARRGYVAHVKGELRGV
jgi:hypothetical protein